MLKCERYGCTQNLDWFLRNGFLVLTEIRCRIGYLEAILSNISQKVLINAVSCPPLRNWEWIGLQQEDIQCSLFPLKRWHKIANGRLSFLSQRICIIMGLCIIILWPMNLFRESTLSFAQINFLNLGHFVEKLFFPALPVDCRASLCPPSDHWAISSCDGGRDKSSFRLLENYYTFIFVE